MTAKRASRLEDPLPYYKWFVLDYRASRNAGGLSYIERGLYRELLDECWQEGAIPNDLQRLAAICRCPLGVMQRAWPKLVAFFAPVDGLDGVFMVNPKLERQRTEADSVRVKRALAGKAGGTAKPKGEHDVQANASKCKQMPYSSSRAEQSSSRRAKAFASPDGAQMLRCPECGARGAYLAAGLHIGACSEQQALIPDLPAVAHA